METKEKITPRHEETTVTRLFAYYQKNKGKRKKWGNVSLENMAREIGVGYPALHSWINYARGLKSGRLPQVLSLRAVSEFLKKNK